MNKFTIDFYYLNRFCKKICSPFRTFKRRIVKEHRNLVKTAITFEPWNWYYQLELEKAGLQRMIAYFKKYGHYVDCQKEIKEMQICCNLIDIITEKVEIEYVNRRVNIKNAYRFAPNKTTLEIWTKENKHSGYILSDYYIYKASYLYHKIRNERERTWWD